MHLPKNNRLAWSLAFAAVTLWLTSVPVSWGRAPADALRYFQQSEDDVPVGDALPAAFEADGQNPACVASPPAGAAQVPPPNAMGPAAITTGQEGTFHICGADPQTARAIEALIAGRGFSATLSARGDGCADLMIRVTSGEVNGTSSSSVSVSLGSGRNLSIQLASERGMTHASITAR